MTLIEAKDLSIRFGGATVLDHVSMSVHPGEILTIVGPNGSGKSTLLRALLGILPASSGSVTQKPGLRIGYVPQKLHVDGGLPMTVRRFLSLPTRHSAADASAALARTGMADTEAKQMTDLSGGQFQRVLHGGGVVVGGLHLPGGVLTGLGELFRGGCFDRGYLGSGCRELLAVALGQTPGSLHLAAQFGIRGL